MFEGVGKWLERRRSVSDVRTIVGIIVSPDVQNAFRNYSERSPEHVLGCLVAFLGRLEKWRRDGEGGRGRVQPPTYANIVGVIVSPDGQNAFRNYSKSGLKHVLGRLEAGLMRLDRWEGAGKR